MNGEHYGEQVWSRAPRVPNATRARPRHDRAVWARAVYHSFDPSSCAFVRRRAKPEIKSALVAESRSGIEMWQAHKDLEDAAATEEAMHLLSNVQERDISR